MDSELRSTAADAHVIGVDVGGTKIFSVILGPGDVRDDIGNITDTELTPSVAESPRVVDEIEASIEVLLHRSGSKPAAIGVGIAGFIDLDGIARIAPNSPGLEGVDLPQRLGQRFSLPVSVENDANCVAIATRATVASDVDSVVALTLGTGIGGGVIIGGNLLRGATGFAGEPGHMVIDRSGPECPCGQRGCWERFASGSGLAWLAQQAAEKGDADSIVTEVGGIDSIDGEVVAAMAREGDAAACAVLEDFAFYVALGVANVIVLLDPELVVIGGGLAELGDQLLAPVRRNLTRHFPSATSNRDTRVILAPQGPEAGAWGAALLARRSLTGGSDLRAESQPR